MDVSSNVIYVWKGIRACGRLKLAGIVCLCFVLKTSLCCDCVQGEKQQRQRYIVCFQEHRYLYSSYLGFVVTSCFIIHRDQKSQIWRKKILTFIDYLHWDLAVLLWFLYTCLIVCIILTFLINIGNFTKKFTKSIGIICFW